MPDLKQPPEKGPTKEANIPSSPMRKSNETLSLLTPGTAETQTFQTALGGVNMGKRVVKQAMNPMNPVKTPTSAVWIVP